MNPNEFAHLHVHSDASLIDGLGPVARLVQGAKSIGFNTLALTDHGSFANAVLFSIACEAAGIKPILGVEGYVEHDGQTGHITLLADGVVGFSNLVALNNLGHSGTGGKPSFSVDQLVSHSADVVCFTGCVASPLHSLSLDDAVHLGARLKAAFGPRLFSELMFVADSDTWTRSAKLAERLNLKMVVTNDVHFPFKNDAAIHPILTSMKAGFTYNSKNLFLRTPNEIAVEMAKCGIGGSVAESIIHRTRAIADKLRPVNLKREPKLPAIEHAHEQLKQMVIQNLKLVAGRWPSSYINTVVIPRVKYELEVIKTMDYSSYFVILADIIHHAQLEDVRVGPGRGSGAGSLVLYLLGVTDIDPLFYDLSFERFLNPERKGMPDVDVDFDSEHRDKVIEYAKTRWGAVPVATYARYSHKTAVHDLAKVLHIDRGLEELIAEKGAASAEFKQARTDVPNFAAAYDTILGQIRHRGKHAGGVVITDGIIPLERAGDITVAAWTEGEDRELSYAGIVKFDLLGLSALSVLRRLEHRLGRKADAVVDGDPVFSIFRNGDLQGIFQFSGSQGILELTRKLAPSVFEDLVAINALYRPGALDVGSTDMYPEWKKSPRAVDPMIADILKPTYGAVVYQEQVMAIFARIMGGTLGQADLARRVIVKSHVGDPKWEAEFATLQDQFTSGCITRGMRPGAAEQLWKELASHARYSFNRAHAVAYARVAWEMAWWKFHHPTEFYTQMLNVDSGEAQTYIYDALNHGIQVTPPNVNRSSLEYECTGMNIYMPLTSVKHLGLPGASAIVSARSSASFTSADDFMARVPKKVVRGKAREGLFELGSFEGVTFKGDGYKELAIKPTTIADLGRTPYQKQQEYLGFVIPTVATMERIKRARSEAQVAGVVSGMKDKTSRYGPYRVFYLLPEGICWTRDTVDIAVGDIIVAKVRKESGKALSITKLV
jgi:DNA polymerase-3 subunit alpha